MIVSMLCLFHFFKILVKFIHPIWNVLAYGRILIVGILWLLTGCSESCCNDDNLNPINDVRTCALDTNCPAGQQYRFGRCIKASCESDEDCCPGSRCRLDIGTCFNRQYDEDYACTTAKDCPTLSHRCVETSLGTGGRKSLCTMQQCTGHDACEIGENCIDGYCVAGVPCEQICPAGTVCDMHRGECAKIPQESTGCDQHCSPGEVAVFANAPLSSGETCCEISCICLALPSKQPTRLGLYTDIAVDDNFVWVSSYEEADGDLVLSQYDKSGKLMIHRALDGVPESGTVLGNPEGYRRGITEPGPNVGTHTAIATRDGKVAIAYTDVDNRSLKVGVWDGTQFVTSTIDGPNRADGTVGMFPDIVMTETGQIVVSYFFHRVTLAGQVSPVSGVKVSRSNTFSPRSQSDWQSVLVDFREQEDPCANACGNNTVCVIHNRVAQCAPPTGGCNDLCSDQKVCVQLNTGAQCKSLAALPDFPRYPAALGLHTSMANIGDVVYVAYYDGQKKDLRLAKIQGTTTETWTIDGDGQNSRLRGDVGRWPSILLDNLDNLLIAYEDTTRHGVRLWKIIVQP